MFCTTFLEMLVPEWTIFLSVTRTMPNIFLGRSIVRAAYLTCITGWIDMLPSCFTLAAFLLITSFTLKWSILRTQSFWDGGTDENESVSNFFVRHTTSLTFYGAGLHRSPLYTDWRTRANCWANFAFFSNFLNQFLKWVTVWLFSSKWRASISKGDFGA